MPQYSLIFLPDISGFTRFVNDTEVSHSQHIIAELMETLIDANTLRLELAEIEGDALFYYSIGNLPDKISLYEQVETMYLRFHEHLKQYDHHRVCQCGACSTAINLKLKFFAHGGPLDFIQIKGSQKPYGKEVIWAHRLMKNNVPIDEYFLISEQALDILPANKDRTHSIEENEEAGKKVDKDMGELPYRFHSLEKLMDKIGEVPPVPRGDISPSPIIFETDVNRPVGKVFDLVSNLEFRTMWNQDIEKLDYDPAHMNRLGSKHTCLINGKDLNFETVTNDFGSGKWVYGEKTRTIPLFKSMTSYFILEPDDQVTHLRMELHTEPWPLVGKLIKPITDRFLKNNLAPIVEHIKRTAENLH